MLRQVVYCEEDISEKESFDEVEEEEDQEEFRYDWMHLVEMGPNAIINSLSDLGIRDMD